LFELRSQRGNEWCRIHPIMASNHRWRGPLRCRGLRCESAVAQLSTLGIIEYNKQYKITYEKPTHDARRKLVFITH
jgi:hypothetical protein